MLKVVGASWFQTRVSTCIVGAVFGLGVLAIILGEFDVEEDDGVYSATVFWHEEAGFHIDFWGQGNELDEIPYGVSRAYYKQEIDTTGWAVFEVETRPEYPDWVQAYAAGLLEGSLTWQIIHWHWLNTVEDVCEDRGDFCDRVYDFIEENYDSLKILAEEREDKDPFWHQVHLFYVQLDGLETGWRHGVKRSRQDIDISHRDFIWMNMVSDLADMEMYYNSSLSGVETPYIFSTAASFASAFVGFQSENGKLYAAHNSGGLYQSMLRMLKRYQFGYHFTADDESALVPGQTISFSSYPGVIHSQDDFYLVTGDPEFGKKQHQLAILGTALNTHNRSSFGELNPKEQVLIGPRVMAANRIAQDGRFWGRYLAHANSNTGSKQWLIVDYGQVASTDRPFNATLSTPISSSMSTSTSTSSPTTSKSIPTPTATSTFPTTSPTPTSTVSSPASAIPTTSPTPTSTVSSPASTSTPRSTMKPVVSKMRKGLLWVVEQLPGFMHSADQTLALVRKGSWVSSGEPVYQNKSNGNSRSATAMHMPQHFFHTLSDAANLTSVMQLMRNNTFLSHPYLSPQARSRRPVSPPPVPMGTIDTKVLYASPFESTELFVVSGPLNPYLKDNHSGNKSSIVPFQWSKSRFANESHVGLPDVIQFDFLQPEWAWY